MTTVTQSTETTAFSSTWSCFFAVVCALFLMTGCPAEEDVVTEDPPPPDEPTEQEGEGYLELRALYSEDGEEVEGARFTVVDQNDEQVLTRTVRTGHDLEAGTYTVTATHGQASATQEAVILADERTELDMVLDAGVLEASVLLVEDGPEAGNPRFEILSTEEDIRGDRETIVSRTRRSSFTLPKGSYLVRATEREASATEEVEIRAGERTDVTIHLDAGLLFARAVEQDGEEAEGRTRWSIQATETDIRGERESVVSSTLRDEFVLPEGEYVLQVRIGDRSASESIRIEAGERLDADVALPPVDAGEDEEASE